MAERLGSLCRYPNPGVILMTTPALNLTIPYWRFSHTMTATPEQSELDGLRNLDSQVIAAVYDRYFTDVFRYVRYRIGDESAAEDIASDVFVRLLEASQKGRGPQTNLKAWLLGTASHILTDHMRRSYRRPTESLTENVLDPLATPVDELERRERGRSVRDALAQLTPEQQPVLTLRFGEGYSLEETAAILKKNVNAVKALQFRALASLQRGIGEVSHE
jgi:RNA polymerase sigma-70 factor (ECF subfamily)